ncbi:pksN [Symbiodinium sp. CCMP2592]|nr:pksN [Symbiodinium sp. CCMP2592]
MVAFWKLRPGNKAVVYYDDDDVWHERRVLLPGGSPESYWVRTPDADLYEEDFQGGSSEGPRRVRHVPFGVKTLPNLRVAVYRFKEDLTDDDLRKWIKEAIQEHTRSYGREPDLSDVQVELADGSLAPIQDVVGVRRPARRLTGKGPRDRTETPGASGPGTWLVADPRHGLPLGSPIIPDFNKDLKLDDENGVARVRGQWVRVEWVATGQEASWKKARASELNSHLESDEALADDLKLLPAVKDTPEDDEGTVFKDKAGEDVRTLWIIYDDQNERHREWRSVVQECVTHSFADWPYQGPQSTMHMLKHIQRHGGEPKSWLQLWLRKHNVSESDRVCHELKTLVDIVYLGGCYDQLNLASLASFEAASRRIQTIVEAFSGASGGSGPDWSHARLYTGQATADDIVSPELRTWAAKRGKEEVELAQARAKIRDAKRLGSHASEGNETGDQSEAPAPALPGRGRGRGRTAKGLEVLFRVAPRTFSSAFDAGRKVLVQIEQAIVTETGATFTPSALQSEIVERVVKLSSEAYELDASFSSPPTPEAALRELLRGADDYVDSVSTLAAYRRERISMPAPERMLRPEEDFQCDIVPYWDPALRNSSRAYKDLIRHLHKIGYLDFTLEPKERAGIFFVNKANDKIRLIIDGRRANARLREPPGVSLATAEAFARFEMEDCSDQDPTISVGLSDVKDCFHRMTQPRWLREYVALDPIPAGWVGLQGTSLGGITLARDDLIYPMPAPLCMGCSWSLFFRHFTVPLSLPHRGEIESFTKGTFVKPPRKASERSSSSSTTDPELETTPTAKVQKNRVPKARVKRRLRKYLDQAFEAVQKGSTLLEDQAVTSRVQRYYQTELNLLHDFVKRQGLPFRTDEQVDAAIVKFMNACFWKGHQAHKGEKLLASFMHSNPSFGRLGSRKLPRSWRALKGWRRLCPAHSRRPWPLAVWCAIACELRRMKRTRMAVYTMVALSTYARPSELLRCTTYSLIPPVRSATAEWTLLLSPEHLETPGKTGEYDLSVSLDSSYLKPWSLSVFGLLKKQEPTAPLWDFSYGDYVKAFSLAAQGLGLQLSPYQMRHSGPRVAQPAGNSEARKLEKCEIGDALREIRQTGRRLPGPVLQDAPARAVVRRTSRGCHPRSKGGSGTAMKKHRSRYFLDLFSGSGGVSRCLRALGFRSYEVDVKHGARFDLTDRSVLHKILVSIQRAEVLGAVFAPSMNSFSVARDRTAVIRNRADPWGLPFSTLAPADQQRVLFGNACAKSVLRLIGALDRYRLPWCVVHPLGSKLWLLPPFDSLAALPHVHSQVVDSCQLGAQCKRPVRLLFGNLDSQDLERLSPLRCRGFQGVCSRTQKRHKQWSSTSTTPPYPAQLYQHLAYVLAAPYLTTDPSTLWLPSA